MTWVDQKPPRASLLQRTAIRVAVWVLKRLDRLRCPHHASLCRGPACCCRDRHWRGGR